MFIFLCDDQHRDARATEQQQPAVSENHALYKYAAVVFDSKFCHVFVLGVRQELFISYKICINSEQHSHMCT